MARAAVLPPAWIGRAAPEPRGHGLVFLAPVAGLGLWALLILWLAG